MWRPFAIGACALTLSACATGHGYAAPVGRTSPDVLTAHEMVAARVVDAYQAVVRLRPEFLRRRNAIGFTGIETAAPRVFLDDTELGGLEALRNIAIDDVTMIRYLSATEAGLRLGTRAAAGGVIVVSTSRRAR